MRTPAATPAATCNAQRYHQDTPQDAKKKKTRAGHTPAARRSEVCNGKNEVCKGRETPGRCYAGIYKEMVLDCKKNGAFNPATMGHVSNVVTRVCVYIICMYVCMYVCMYICIYVYMYVCMYVCMCVCVYIYNTYIRICYICMYVQTHTHTQTHEPREYAALSSQCMRPYATSV
jgi:hypothetical protein